MDLSGLCHRIATIIAAVLRFREFSTRGTGGDGGFAVLGELINLWVLTLLGLEISLVSCVMSIPRFNSVAIA